MQSLLHLIPSLLAATSATALFGYAAGSYFDGFAESPWAYWALAASAGLAEELSPILGGIAANEGELELVRVMVAVTIGAWIFTALLYVLGRLKWEWIRRKWPRVRATGTVALRVVGRNPITASFFVRFAFGLRIVLPMACGAARVPLAIFVPATLVGSAIWSVLFSLLGYGAGKAAVRVIGHLSTAGEVIGALVVTAAVLGFMRWNKRRGERKAQKRHAAASRAVAEASKAVEQRTAADDGRSS